MRLIDADELLQKRWQVKDITDKDLYVIGQGFVVNAPTIDAAPVVHAKWELPGKGISDMFLICTYCNKLHVSAYKTNYCPYCGAKMDLEEE